MMQSLAEVEPVALETSFECVPGLSGHAEEKPFPVPAPDPGVAERFESAMADVAAGAPDVRRMVLAFNRIGETVADGAAPRRLGNTPSCPDAHVAGGFPDTAIPEDAENPYVMDIRIVGGLPDAPVHTVADDSPEMPAFKSSGPAEAPVRTAASNPPEMPVYGSGAPAEAPVRTVAGDLPEMPAFKSSGPTEAPVRTAAGNPPGMSLRKVDGNSPGTAGHVVLDAPRDMPAREVGAAGGASPEQAQIIAPAPLPIELPASPVWQQPVSAAPSGVARMFVAAAEAVADAILVSSGFANGEGSLIVRLRPGVLNGSEVRISAKDGALTVVVNAATQDVQNAVEANRAQFEQHLAEKIHSWRISVAVRRGGKTDERV